jgi:hypothetical protein
MKLNRLDKPLGTIRTLLQRVYRGQAEEVRATGST